MSTTKYPRTSKWMLRIGIFLCVLPFILLAILAACTPTNTPAPTPTAVERKVLYQPEAVYPAEKAPYIGGGDCSADRATGDLYVNPDPYCLTDSGEPSVVATLTAFVQEIRQRIRETATAIVTATASPSATSTQTSTATATASPTITATNTPSKTPTGTFTPPPTVTGTPSPTATENPTATATATEKPTNTPSPVPTECKNKNSGKDGTPGECNAGGGQEKHDGTIVIIVTLDTSPISQ